MTRTARPVQAVISNNPRSVRIQDPDRWEPSDGCSSPRVVWSPTSALRAVWAAQGTLGTIEVEDCRSKVCRSQAEHQTAHIV